MPYSSRVLTRRASVKRGNFAKLQASFTAVMSAFVVGYELAGWSFLAFRRSPWLGLAAKGAQEAAIGQLSEETFLYKRVFKLIASTFVFRLASSFLPIAVPFDLEEYLLFHYRKTREQSLHLLNLYIDDAINGGYQAGHIQLLLQGLHGMSSAS